MTTGTKIFLAVFALIVGVLVIYYGVANRGHQPAGDESLNSRGGAADTSLPREVERSGDRGRLAEREMNPPREAPPPRQAVPLTPMDQTPASASEAGGLLSEGLREASGEASSAPSATFLPLIGLNAPRNSEQSSDTRAANPPAAEQDRVPALRPGPQSNQSSAEPVIQSPAARPLPSAPARPLRTEYTIKAGDTFTSIAQEWFDDGTKWSLIARENPTVDPARLKIGQKVYLPPKDAAVASSREARGTQIVPAEGELIYTVREGDTLSSIARQHYDDPARWKDIHDANRATIGSDAGALEIGMKLRLKMVKR